MFQGVEVEIPVYCASGETHPVQVRYTGWSPKGCEVVFNPCTQAVGESLGKLAPCMKELEKGLPQQKFWEHPANRLEILKQLEGVKDKEVIPLLVGAMRDPDPYIVFAAAEFLANFKGEAEVADKLLEMLWQKAYEIINMGYPSKDFKTWSLWSQFLAACMTLTEVGLVTPFQKANLRHLFVKLCVEKVYYESRNGALILPTREWPVVEAVGTVLAATGSRGDLLLLATAGVRHPTRGQRESNSGELSDEELQFFLKRRWEMLNE